MLLENRIVKAFCDAARDAMSTMAMLELEVESVERCQSLSESLGYAAVLGLSGEKDGVLVITLGRKLARQIVASVLGMEESEVETDEEILDGVGEVANMTAGGAKGALSDTPDHFDLSLPTTVVGEKVELRPKPGTEGVLVTCGVGSEPCQLGIWKDGVTDS